MAKVKTNLLQARGEKNDNIIDLLQSAKQHEIAQNENKVEYIEKTKIIILDDLKKFIRKQTEEEHEVFVKSIKEEGIRDPLYISDIGNYKNVLIDGHHRYNASSEDLLPINRLNFTTITEAQLWMVTTQLGRRNLKQNERVALVLKYDHLTDKGKEKKRRNLKKGQISRKDKSVFSGKEEKIDSNKKLAEQANVSTTTIKKAKRVMKNDPDLFEKMERGEVTIHKAHDIVANKENASPLKGSSLQNKLNENKSEQRLTQRIVRELSVKEIKEAFDKGENINKAIEVAKKNYETLKIFMDSIE